jgi:lysyl-tRNA synthetase class 2
MAVDGIKVRVVDAYSAVDVLLRLPGEIAPGDLVVVSGVRRGQRLVQATLSERHPAPVPRGESEVGRFVWRATARALQARQRAVGVIRSYFRARRFLEVDTPLRVLAPGLDLHVDALRAEGGWLVTSPEFQMKRLLVGGVPRCYQLAHCFRKDELGPWHEPEFSMLEWYRAFAGMEAVMRDTEQIVARVVKALTGRHGVMLDGRRFDVTPPFERLTVREAFHRHAGGADALELAEHDPDGFFKLLVGSVEPALAARRRPVFLCEYPISQASLARASPRDPRLAERFELYLAGIELCNGFGELTDAQEQLARFEADLRQRQRLRRPVYPLDQRFLAALREGMPPAAGNALGIDRLITLAIGAHAIAEVQAFPAAWL